MTTQKNSNGWTRRNMLHGAGAGALVGGAALSGAFDVRSAFAADKLTFVTPFRYLIAFSPVMNAHSGGYFKKQGFDSVVQGGTGSSSALQQVLAGRAKFTRTSSLDIIKAVANQGVPLVGISTMVQGSVFNVVSLADKPIKTPADMKGKTIGVVSVGGGTENLLNMMLVQSGIDPKSVPRKAVGNSPGAFGLVKQGRIDAYIVSLGSVIALRKMGEKIHAWSTDKHAPNPSQVYCCTKATIDKEPETVQRFLKAIKGSVDEIVGGNRAAIFDRMRKDFDIIGAKRREITLASLDGEIELWFSQGKENLMRNVPKLWDSAQDLAAKVGLGKIDRIEDLYTNTFVDKL